MTGAVKLDSLKTSGSAFLQRAVLDSVDLDFARIARSLFFGSGSRIGGQTNLERTKIQGNLIVRGHEQVGDLHFLGTQMSKTVTRHGSELGWTPRSVRQLEARTRSASRVKDLDRRRSNCRLHPRGAPRLAELRSGEH